MIDNTWKILIIDDDEGIHSITKMVFRNYQFENNAIQLLHAFSASEAEKVLTEQNDIAVVLLDVVMETDDAGLNLVNTIRNDLKLKDLRIILRTGHPGFAPEAEIIVLYDINDYLSKAELSASRLVTSVTVAIRSYRDIKTASNQQSELIETPLISSNSNQKQNELLDEIAQQMDRTVSSIVEQNFKLQQFKQNPMTIGLIDSLNNNCNKLKNYHALLQPLKPALDTGIQLLDSLNTVIKLYIDQANQNNWILDYEVAPSVPKHLNVSKDWFELLLIILIETVTNKYLVKDIVIDVSRINDRINIAIKGPKQERPEQMANWHNLLNQKLIETSSFYESDFSFEQEHSLILFSFSS